MLEPFDKTALHVAVEQGDSEAVKLLLATGAWVSGRAGIAGHVANDQGDSEAVKLLLGTGEGVCSGAGVTRHVL